MKVGWLSVATVLGLILALPWSAQSAVALKFAHNNNPGHPIHEAAVRFAEVVNGRSNGEVHVTIFPSSQLGRMNETWTGVKLGAIEIGGGTPLGTLADLVPELSLFDAPYMFRDLEHFRRVSSGLTGQELGRKLVEKGGVRILYYQYFGVRHLTTTNTPVHRPEDVKGLKIRAVPTPILMATLEGLGGRPTPMDFAEVYQSLRSGIVDGQDNAVPTIYTSKYFEVQKYLILTGHIHAFAAAVIHEKVYQALSPGARAAVDQGAIEAPAYGNALALRQEAEMLAELRKSGMTVIGPEQGLDLEAFRARVRGYVYPKFEAQWTKSLMEQVQALGK
jgi:tripartite ATP-independent transporter DctP family solute receptor